VGEISASLYVNTIDLQSIEHRIETSVYLTTEAAHIQPRLKKSRSTTSSRAQLFTNHSGFVMKGRTVPRTLLRTTTTLLSCNFFGAKRIMRKDRKIDQKSSE